MTLMKDTMARRWLVFILAGATLSLAIVALATGLTAVEWLWHWLIPALSVVSLAISALTMSADRKSARAANPNAHKNWAIHWEAFGKLKARHWLGLILCLAAVAISLIAFADWSGTAPRWYELVYPLFAVSMALTSLNVAIDRKSGHAGAGPAEGQPGSLA
jgi:hypothetical protein